MFKCVPGWLTDFTQSIYIYTVVDVTSGRSASGNETNQVDVVSNKSVVGTCLPPEQDPQSHGAGS